MKKMNVIPLFISLFMMISCTNQEQLVQDKTSTSKASEEEGKEYLYALEVYYVSAVAEINNLKLKKAELIAELEGGDKEVINEIENIQKRLEKLNQFKDYLLEMRIPRAPKPIKMPPIGCLEGNCNPLQDLTSISGIVLGDTFKVSNLEIRNAKDQVIAKGTIIGKDSFGQRTMMLEADFTGQATMITTIEGENIERIILSTPVFKNK